MPPWRWLDPEKLGIKSHRILVASNPAIVAGAIFSWGWWGDDGRFTAKAFLAHTNLLQEDRYTPFNTEKQRIQYLTPHQHDEVPKFLSSLIRHQRLPWEVFIMTKLNRTWNLTSHSLQELPTEPIGIWHTMWPINVRKLTKKWDRIFFKTWWGWVVKMKMIVFAASLKSGSFEKSGISGMASWHVYAGLILWKNHRQLIVG